MQYSLRSATALAAGLLVILLAGCATPAAGTGPASSSRAERLLQQNNPVAAAQMYEELARNNPPAERLEFVLAAARAWLSANRADDAQRVIDAAGSGLPAAQKFELDLLRGEVAVARGQYAPAWREVAQITAPPRPADAARLYLLQQQVALRAGQPVEGVRAGIERERVATSDADKTRAKRDLLNDLRSAIDRGVRIDPTASRDAQVRGWLELAQIAASAGQNPQGTLTAIDRWRTRFPGHPADTIAASEIVTPAERAAPRTAATPVNTSPIALLLPLSGQQVAAGTRTAATLVRDGFMAAIARLPEAARPPVKVYDTGVTPVGTALQNARSEGAGLLVGPLTREEVQTAAAQRPADLPMLLLNNLAGSGIVGSNLYQYALAPEDEARQIARQMAGSGQRNAMVLSPIGEWGTRVAAAFTDEFTRAGGRISVQGNYDINSTDLATRVMTLLGLDESRDRHEKLQRITGATLAFDARPRPDVDAIFAAGWQSLALRQINPMLDRFAGSLPVYTTQDGLVDDTKDNSDLSGMYVLDMPWMLESGGPTADLKAATEATWGPRGQRQSRYFAFGFDAASLAMAIRANATTAPLSGLTGRLKLTPEGRVERTLNWARIGRDGAVQPADPAAQ